MTEALAAFEAQAMPRATRPSGGVRRLTLAIAIGLMSAMTLGGGLAISAPSSTRLTASVTASSSLIETYPWTVTKSADPSTLELELGDSAWVTYTVHAAKGTSASSAQFSGSVCVNNDGQAATSNLDISVTVTLPPSKAVLGSGVAQVWFNPILGAGQSYCYPYDVGVDPATPGGRYRVTGTVTIDNHTGPTDGPIANRWARLATTPAAVYNDSVFAYDTNGQYFTWSATTQEEYLQLFPCYSPTSYTQTNWLYVFTYPEVQTTNASVNFACSEGPSTPFPSPSGGPESPPPTASTGPGSPPLSPPLSPPVCPPGSPPISPPLSPPVSPPISGPVGPPMSEPVGEPSPVESLPEEATPAPTALGTLSPAPLPTGEPSGVVDAIFAMFISQPISPPISGPLSPPVPPPCPTTAIFIGATTVHLLATVLTIAILVASLAAVAALSGVGLPRSRRQNAPATS